MGSSPVTDVSVQPSVEVHIVDLNIREKDPSVLMDDLCPLFPAKVCLFSIPGEFIAARSGTFMRRPIPRDSSDVPEKGRDPPALFPVADSEGLPVLGSETADP
jgi:hypothetical protein